MGLVQAIISFAADHGDEIQSIKAGRRRMVFFVKHALYFLCISSTGEPESSLRMELQYLYQQILFVLTAKVHSVFQNSPAYDLRELLGGMAVVVIAVDNGEAAGAESDACDNGQTRTSSCDERAATTCCRPPSFCKRCKRKSWTRPCARRLAQR